MGHLDCDADEVVDYGENTPFLPYGDGKYQVHLTAFFFKDGFKSGKSYRIYFKVLESDRADVKVGYTYARMIKVPPQGENDVKTQTKRRVAAHALRSLAASVMGEDPKNKEFEANPVLETLEELHKEGQLEDANMLFQITARNTPPDPENGNKTFTNYFYDPIGVAA